MLQELTHEFDDVYIEQPEFKYIFTVDLKGRIVNLVNELDDNLFSEESDIVLSEGNERIYAHRMEKSFVKYYIDKHFLKHATPVRWIFNEQLQKNILADALQEFSNVIKCHKCPKSTTCGAEYSKFKTFVSGQGNGRLDFVNISGLRYSHLIAGIEIKLFSQGALSILLRFKYFNPDDRHLLSISKCANYVRYPENIIILKDECYLGPLNEYAFIVARKALERLVIDESYNIFRPKIEENYKSLDKDRSLGSVLEKTIKGFEKKAQLYVGLFCQGISEKEKGKEEEFLNWIWNRAGDPTQMRSEEENKKFLIDKKKFLLTQRIILSLANNTPEFLKYFKDPDKYIWGYPVD